jgi:glutamate N-acetyltransferase / amino-acid N-acetyltransferase
LKKVNDALVVPGFIASGVHAGIKEDGRKDLALIFSEVPATAAGVFTTNSFKAAPVILDMKRIRRGEAQAIVINSGNANAATGERGYADALAMSKAVSDLLQIRDDRVLVASTGVIGRKLPIKKIRESMGKLVSGLDPKGIAEAGEAILTTDKYPKNVMRRGTVGGRNITLCGIAKGAGMIEPRMATMLSFIMTDLAIKRDALDLIFRTAVDKSFNAVTVDGCMSTNDSAIILANGVAGNRPMGTNSKELSVFRDLVTDMMIDLAKSIVRDGEGATKVIEIVVETAKSEEEARKVAYQVARSSLVKTAFYGKDPNWGRVISAVGASDVSLSAERVELYFENVPLFMKGTAIPSNLPKAMRIMEQDEIRVTVRLGSGKEGCRIFCSDLTIEYVSINAHYTT